MPFRQRETSAPRDDLDAMLAQISSEPAEQRRIWGRVHTIEVSMIVPRKVPEPLFTFEITHVEGEWTARGDLKGICEACTVHAKKRGAATKYFIEAIATGEVPRRKRGESPREPEDVIVCRWEYRAGEDDPAATPSGIDGSLTKLLGDVVGQSPKIMDAMTTQVEKVLGLGEVVNKGLRDEIEILRNDNASLRQARREDIMLLVELKKLEVTDNAQVRAEQREEEAKIREEEAAKREHEAAMQAQQHQHENHQMLLGMAKVFGPLFMTIVMKNREMKANPPPPDEPQDTELVQEIAALLATVVPEEREQLSAVLGERIWDLIVAAGKSTSNNEAKGRLMGIKAEIDRDATFAAKLIQAGGILGPQRSSTLLEILTRAGVWTP